MRIRKRGHVKSLINIRNVDFLGTAVAEALECLTTGWTPGVRSPTGSEDFSSSPCVQTSCGAHPASCPMGSGGPFPGGKARPGGNADHSPPSSAEVKYD
jgi:hypothetical protein